MDLSRDDLRDLVRASQVWGAELDIRFRVLAVTVEPAVEVHPDAAAGDRRLQLLFHPVSAVAASLVEHDQPAPVVRRFDEEQLPDVVAAFGGAVTTTDPLPGVPADLDALGPRLSMRGHASTGDGFRDHLHLRLVDDALSLDLWASFDEFEVRGPQEPPAEGSD